MRATALLAPTLEKRRLNAEVDKPQAITARGFYQESSGRGLQFLPLSMRVLKR
jgi:prolyl-tRNA synthetase